jgi:hypothetical protein
MKQIKFCEMINKSNLNIVIVNRSKLGMVSLLSFAESIPSRITSLDRSNQLPRLEFVNVFTRLLEGSFSFQKLY